MKSWKTTLAGLIAGLPGVIDALVTAYNAGYFTGKTGIELITSIGIIVLGVIAKDHNVSGGVTKILMPVILVVGFSQAGRAQSILSALPKPAAPVKAIVFARAIVSPFDSIPAGKSYTGLRFTGPTVMYATSLKSLKQADLFTFVGIDYEKATWDAPSQKYYTNWAIGLHFGEGGQFAPNSISAVTAVAVSGSTQKIGKTNLPFKLTVGVIYNISTKQALPGVGPGIPLNN